MMRARPWIESVITPAWLPVNERACMPRFAIAMASSAIEMRSPDVRSMSSSRAGGQRRNLGCEREQVVGGIAHRGHHDAHVMALFAGRDDALRDLLDALSVGDRRAAVLLDDEAHGLTLLERRRPP